MSRGYRAAALTMALCVVPIGGAHAATKKPRADLVVSSVSNAPSTATPGASLPSGDTTRNRGRATAAASTTRYFLSLDAKVNKGDIRLAQHRVPRLRAGRSFSQRATLRIPTFAKAGSYRVLACADRLHSVRESNDRNNCTSAKRRVAVIRTFVPGAGPGPDGGPLPGPSVPGGLSISPGTQAFGSVGVGSSSAATTFTVTNTGEAASGTIGTSLVGAAATQFAVASDECAGKTLPGGGTCAITVRFSPSSTGAKLAGIQVSGKPGGTVAAELSGTGLTPANLSISPGSHEYGTVPAGASSPATTFTITNTGEASSGALASGIAGSDLSQFAISADSCANAALAGGGTCTVSVRFAPNAEGPKSASLQVSGTPGGAVSAALSGTGTLFTITPASHAFPATAVGSVSAAQQFTVKNVGSVPAVMSAGSGVVPGTDSSHFGQNNQCIGTLAPNATCIITITFAPSTPGAKSATLQVSGAPGGTVSAALTGTALTPANVTLEPASHSFRTALVGSQSAAVTFTVRNTGEATSGPITAALAGTNLNQFAISANTCTVPLAGGATCTVSVRFAPTSGGDKSASLQVSASPGTPPGTPRTAALTGQGTFLTITPPNGDFSATVGTPSTALEFTITNTSNTTTPALTATLTGTDAGQFEITGSTCATVPAMGTCTVSVRFSPTGLPGTRVAALEISGSTSYNTRAPLTGTAT